MAILGAAPAQAHPVFTNEPQGYSELLSWGHDALTGGGWYDVYDGYNSSIIEDESSPMPGGPGHHVLQQRFPAGLVGGNGGGGGSLYNFPTAYPSVFYAYWMKVDANYENHGVATKVSWIHTPNNNLFAAISGQGTFTVSLNWQWADNDPSNDHLGFIGSGYLGTSQTFKAGEWVKIEMFFKPSTTKTSRDGQYHLWMDGIYAAGTDQLNTPPDLYPSAVSHITIWGGTGGAKTRDSFMYWDHEYVSVGDGLPTMTPSPSPPSHLTVG